MLVTYKVQTKSSITAPAGYEHGRVIETGLLAMTTKAYVILVVTICIGAFVIYNMRTKEPVC